MGADSESFLLTIPMVWSLQKHAIDNRKYPSIQDFVRELIRRDIEGWDKQIQQQQQPQNENKT